MTIQQLVFSSTDDITLILPFEKGKEVIEVNYCHPLKV